MKPNDLATSVLCILALATSACACTDPEDVALEQTEAAVLDSFNCPPTCVDNGYPLLFAGGELTFLSLDSHSGGHALFSLDDTSTGGTDLTLAGADNLSDQGYAPRVWLGVNVNEYWSIVGRYWRLEDSGADRPVAPPGAVNLANLLQLSGTSEVDAFTADLEADATLNNGPWQFTGMVGARHALLDTKSRLTTGGIFTGSNEARLNLSDGSSFEGTGLSGGVVARRRIGCTPFHLYVGGRASKLDGDSDSFGRAAVDITSPPNNLNNSIAIRRHDGSASMTIGELQAGVGYDVQLSLIPAYAFFRVGYEYQNWDIDGHAANGPNYNGSVGNVDVSATVSPGIGDLRFNGLTLATGLAW